MVMGVMLRSRSRADVSPARPLSVAGGLRASPACSQYCHGAVAHAGPAAGALAAHLQPLAMSSAYARWTRCQPLSFAPRAAIVV